MLSLVVERSHQIVKHSAFSAQLVVSEAADLRHRPANPFLVIVVLAIVVDDVGVLFFYGTTLAASCRWRLQSTLRQNRIFTLTKDSVN